MDEATVTLCQMTDDPAARIVLGVLLHRAGGGALRRSVDQALIRGLGTAFRVFVSGLVLCLEGGRRAQPGHVASDRNSPPWLPPGAVQPSGLLRLWSEHDGLSSGIIRWMPPFESAAPVKAFSRVSGGPQGRPLPGRGSRTHSIIG